MPIAITTISILAITGAVWLLNKVLPFKVCPICVGVSGTWLWMLLGILFKLLPTSQFQLPTAILMGGSVVGIAYQTEKFLRDGASPLLWKTVFVPAGFAVMYGFLSSSWTTVGITLVFLVVFAFAFLRLPFSARRSSDTDAGRTLSKNVKRIENEMKKCC